MKNKIVVIKNYQ